MDTLAYLETELARLASRLDDLCSHLPPEQVLEEFSGEARPVVEAAPAEHEAYVEDRVHAMLVEAGLIPDDSPTG
jgi:hypothetical protein